MKRIPFIQLKAALLLIVFSLNTILSIACGVDIDMGFNTSHHPGKEATGIHVHADGKKHHHDKKTGDHTQKQKKDNCCNDQVTRFSLSDKSVPQTGTIISPVFPTAFIASYHDIALSYSSQVNLSTRYFVLGHHPPIPDILIAIQRFQI